MNQARGICIAGVLLGFLSSAAPARADLVFFSSGRNLSVKSYQVDGNQLVLKLRTGGEITCDRASIARIEPDEVPYPEPEPEPQVAVAAPPAAVPPAAVAST